MSAGTGVIVGELVTCDSKNGPSGWVDELEVGGVVGWLVPDLLGIDSEGLVGDSSSVQMGQVSGWLLEQSKSGLSRLHGKVFSSNTTSLEMMTLQVGR